MLRSLERFVWLPTGLVVLLLAGAGRAAAGADTLWPPLYANAITGVVPGNGPAAQVQNASLPLGGPGTLPPQSFGLFPQANPMVPVDPMILGVWSANVPGGDGSYYVTFQPASDGSYRITASGPSSIPDETGFLVAQNGTWGTTATSGALAGRRDWGTYQLVSSDTLVMVGTQGSVVWTRQS